jgi:amino acid permease
MRNADIIPISILILSSHFVKYTHGFSVNSRLVITTRRTKPREGSSSSPQKSWARNKNRLHSASIEDSSVINKQFGRKEETRKYGKKNELSASAISADLYLDNIDFVEGKPLDTEVIPMSLLQVLSASLLITANTVGPSMLILPDYVKGPGLLVSSGLFLAVYAINLLSGLLIAEVVINQFETSSSDVPSSFKEFSEASLNNKKFGDVVAFLSVFINGAVLAYDLVLVGDIMSSNSDIINTFSPLSNVELSSLSSAIAGMILIAVVGSHTNRALSYLASVCCIILFTSFAGFMIPGLSSIDDPLKVLSMTGGSPVGSASFLADITSCLPILMTTLVYQNIVPSVAKLLDYDRRKTFAATIIGSCIPMCMGIVYCFVALGAELDESVAGIDFFQWFTMSSLIGSSVACVMSMSEEFESCLKKAEEVVTTVGTDLQTAVNRNSLPTIFLSVVPSLAIGLMFSGGQGFTMALSVTGSYACPILYGLVPCALALTQQNESIKNRAELDGTDNTATFQSGSQITVAMVGASFFGFILQQAVHDSQSLFG